MPKWDMLYFWTERFVDSKYNIFINAKQNKKSKDLIFDEVKKLLFMDNDRAKQTFFICVCFNYSSGCSSLESVVLFSRKPTNTSCTPESCGWKPIARGNDQTNKWLSSFYLEFDLNLRCFTTEVILTCFALSVIQLTKL